MNNNVQIAALQAIRGGADIYDFATAATLRAIHMETPHYLTIISMEELEKIHGKKFDPMKQLPYFGAILTAAGKKYLQKIKKAAATNSDPTR